jgi:hypothetical protein
MKIDATSTKEPLRLKRLASRLSVHQVHIAAAAAICILALMLRFACLAHHPFDGDEFASYYITSLNSHFGSSGPRSWTPTRRFTIRFKNHAGAR